jgi:NAD(P)H-dependent glutamate synthase small subunit
MGKPTGFMEFKRVDAKKRPVKQRLKDYKEIELPLPVDELTDQAARCMDCGIPFCHSFGCPLNNLIPDFNDLIYKGHWEKALEILHSTNNFPEVTGRICPAPCEASCTLSINEPAVTIRQIEHQIIERGWREGWIKPQISPVKTGKKIAVVGSGPAGLAAAQQLARQGHEVVLYEKDSRIGGLLRYGIPDFKLEKNIIDRRMEQMTAEGVVFETNVNVGKDVSAAYLKKKFDAVLITAGAGTPRNLAAPGRDLKGIYFAMVFLAQNNKRVAGDDIPDDQVINAKGKNVVVIGGGDTGSDCIGTSNRQGAKNVVQIELLAKPSDERPEGNPWPEWPQTLRTSSSQDEGCKRMWSINTKKFIGEKGQVKKLKCVKLDWSKPNKKTGAPFSEIKGSEFELKADLVFLAMGFVHVEHGPLVEDYSLELDQRGNILTDENYRTSESGVFAAGDASTGASLVVRAIDHGRCAAEEIDNFLMG